VDFVLGWSGKTEITISRFLRWIELGTSKFYDWRQRYGKVNEHNAWVPRDHWLTEEEKRKIVAFAHDHPLDGYRRQTFMMLDADLVAASATSVWRVLHQAGLLARVNGKPSRKGTGFVQPLRPHQDWHVDVSYLNIGGTFYFLCSILDGYSRFIVHWEIREKMEEGDVETIIQRAREQYPRERPRIITDNGPQFIAKDFKEFIRICGMTHVKTSPIRSPMARSNASTAPSRAIAFARRHRCLWRTHAGWSRSTLPITTRFACIAPSVTLPPRTCLQDALKSFSPHAIASSPKPANAARP